jgi:hypothetical protein
MRGASAIVTFAGLDAVGAGVAASRGSWVTSVFGQDVSAPELHWQGCGLFAGGRISGQCDEATASEASGLSALSRPIALGKGKGSAGTVDPGDTSKPNTACGTSSLCSIIPKVLMLTLAEYRIGIRHQGCIGHPAFRTPSFGGEVGMRKTRTRKRRENEIA